MDEPETRCAIRGHCGSKSPFGQQLPCPYDGPAQELDDNRARTKLIETCGDQFAEGPVCCTREQIEVLQDNFALVQTLLASCPACRNNFRDFFCSFTCSPNQGKFLNITATQRTSSQQIAVKSLDFHVSKRYSEGFFDSCKDVKLSSANDYAMTLIGGGAKQASEFLEFLGKEKDPGPGSPFQIDFPASTSPPFEEYGPPPRNCSDSDLNSRCTCIDCLDVCPVMPPVPTPQSWSACNIGSLSCFSFVLTNLYALIVSAYLLAFALKFFKRKVSVKRDTAILPGDDPSDNPLSPRSHTRSLLGASALADGADDASARLGNDSRNLGRGVSLFDPADTQQPQQYFLNTIFRRFFFRLGHFCATRPWLTCSIVFSVFGMLNLGWEFFEIETEPVNLWVAPDSESKLQKEFFDTHFGPFYRPQQIFITRSREETQEIAGGMYGGAGESKKEMRSVLSYDHLSWWFAAESEIRALESPNGYKLSDICFKPSGPGTPCVVQSVTAWFDYDLNGYEDTWEERIVHCARSPADCLPDFRQPLAPAYVLGGIPHNGSEPDPEDYLQARALVVNIVVENSLDDTKLGIAEEWERSLREYLQKLSAKSINEAGLEIHFSTGVSLEEELGKSTNVDARIVIISYLMMFFYVAMTLGSNPTHPSEESMWSSLKSWMSYLPRYCINRISGSSDILVDESFLIPRVPGSIFVQTKFTLGLFGIILVILSVSSSVGFFSFLGVKTTLIIAEVIPFLVLAVGVDNVFILVHEVDRQNALHGPSAAPGARVINASRESNLSPGPLGTSHDNDHDDSADDFSFPLQLPVEDRIARALAKMGPSILLSSVTEFTAFLLGALVPMPAVRNFALYAAGSVLFNAILQVTVFISAMSIDVHRTESNRVDCLPCLKTNKSIALPTGSPGSALKSGTIERFIKRTYAPILLRPVTKAIVILSFAGILVGSLISMQHINLGLDQRLALPSDSYLISYFDAMDDYLDIGPPVYFVVSDIDVTHRQGQQKLCGRFSTCQDYSVANILEGERNRSEVSYLAQPAASWIDDYLHWLNPANSCCRVRRSNESVFCKPRDSPRLCRACLEGQDPPWDITMNGLPEGEEFTKYLQQWLKAPADEDCALGGRAAYSTALYLNSDDVSTSHFRTAHSPLKTQEDFIDSMKSARRVASEISESTGGNVFPYSIHYVFFDQYIHIVSITQEILGLGLAAVLIISAVFLGSWRTGIIVTGVVSLTVINVMGVMGLWNISLNAISLVNLVISLGIAVEFCAHVARAFMGSGNGLAVDQRSHQQERDERMWTALTDVGPSVLSGITFTKLIGISVLGLTRSHLLEIYYFRMWLSLIISGALHGLVLLPVVLSYVGGSGYTLEDVDEEWMSSAIRRDFDYTDFSRPFLADDDSIRSD